jgi:hypothetical protein
MILTPHHRPNYLLLPKLRNVGSVIQRKLVVCLAMNRVS